MGGLKLTDVGGVGWVWIRLLGGEVGSGVEEAGAELRICMASLWVTWRLE